MDSSGDFIFRVIETPIKFVFFLSRKNILRTAGRHAEATPLTAATASFQAGSPKNESEDPLPRLFHDLAFLHHEGDALGGGDVGGGIAGDSDDISEFAFLERSHFLRDT